ncbi:MAG: helix-turn-helix domain-containing protein [Acidobacteria bacterium]|nr:helix-turn-helix domain-containing protein [Acidobacteriota bacterium]
MSKRADYKIGSGNVFTDLGFAGAEEMMAKAVLAHRIGRIIEERKLTQAEAARVMGVDQPKISALRRGRLSGFSLERLLRFLLLLGRDVEIVVKPRRRSRSHSRLLVA